MVQKAKQYLEKNLPKEGEYLLGLSGGPDSMALFYLLLEGGWKFRAVHIDHSWREESKREADLLEAFVRAKGIPFDLITLERIPEVNLEEAYREERLREFQKLYVKYKSSALLLGHQRDDQNETILKRIFESSSLSHLMGMDFEGSLRGMKVIRPLLSSSKQAIIDWLDKRGNTYFIDRTNEDTSYLRARMRKKLMPVIEAEFGKDLQETLYHFGRQMKRLKIHLDERIAPLLEKSEEGPLGWYIPISTRDELELDHLLRRIFEKKGLLPLRGEIETLIEIITQDKVGKKIIKAGSEWIYDQGKLFCIDLKAKRDFCPEGSYKEGDLADWRHIWKGKRTFFLPSSEAVLGPPVLKEKLPSGITLQKWYSQHKVPIIFRDWVPVAYEKGILVGEFLTGIHLYNKNFR